MATEKEHYHKFRHHFYPNGVRDDAAFELLAYLVSSGYTDEQVADYYGVSRITVGNWKRNHEEIWKVWQDNKDTPDSKVERSLFEAACGYELVETKVNISEGSVILTDVIRKVPPDVRAGIFWLTNRKPDKWKSVIHTKNEELPPAQEFDYSQLSEAEMDMFEKLLSKVAKPAATEE